MEEHRILKKLLGVQDIPTLPPVMAKILETLEDAESSASDLADLVESDPVISTRILRLANSAFYGLRTPVDSINRAVVVLGFDAIQQLALATSVFSQLNGRKQFALDAEDFWLHSFGTAKATQLLCAHVQDVGSVEGCFTAGLLHDIGKYLLALALGSEYLTVVQMAQASYQNLRMVEAERLGITNAEAGSWLATKWAFPKLITDVIANTHRARMYAGRYKTEVLVVALANELSCLAEFGIAGDFDNHVCDPNILDSLRLTKPVIEEILEELEGMRVETVHFFNLMQTV